MSEDAALLRRYLENHSEEAFAEIVRRHLGLVYHVALRRLGGDAHRAEDVAQTVFVLLARKARSLAGRASLAGWLFTTARFVAARVARAEMRRRLREREAGLEEQPLENVDRPPPEQLRAFLDSALSALNEQDREALLLRFFGGKKFAEIGVILRSSEDAARRRVERALCKMQNFLQRRGIASTATALATVLGTSGGLAMPAGLAVKITALAVSSVAVPTGFGVAATAIFQAMSTSKVGFSAAIVVAALATWFGVHETQKARQAQALLREERAAREAWQGSAMIQGATQTSPGDRGTAPAESSARPALPAAALPEQSAKAETEETRARLIFSPDMQRLRFEHFKAALPSRYGRWLRELELPAQQLEQVSALLMARFWAMSDALAADRAKPMAEWTSVEELMQQTLAPLDQELRALLGADEYHRLHEHERDLRVGGLLETLAGNLASAAEPISAAQVQEARRILAANNRRPMAEPFPGALWLEAEILGQPSRARNARWIDIDLEATLPQLATVLSSPQMDIVRAQVQQLEANSRASELEDVFYSTLTMP